jgi:hypothetical protein
MWARAPGSAGAGGIASREQAGRRADGRTLGLGEPPGPAGRGSRREHRDHGGAVVLSARRPCGLEIVASPPVLPRRGRWRPGLQPFFEGPFSGLDPTRQLAARGDSSDRAAAHVQAAQSGTCERNETCRLEIEPHGLSHMERLETHLPFSCSRLLPRGSVMKVHL